MCIDPELSFASDTLGKGIGEGVGRLSGNLTGRSRDGIVKLVVRDYPDMEKVIIGDGAAY